MVTEGMRAARRLGNPENCGALELVDPILYQNARRLFRLEEKIRNLRSADWSK